MKLAGLNVYEATRSPGSPICVSSDSEESEITSVSIYARNGEILGLAAYDADGNRLAATGYIRAYEDEDA